MESMVLRLLLDDGGRGVARLAGTLFGLVLLGLCLAVATPLALLMLLASLLGIAAPPPAQAQQPPLPPPAQAQQSALPPPGQAEQAVLPPPVAARAPQAATEVARRYL